VDSKKDKQLVGAAGEHLVLSRLLNLGFLAAQAPRGTRKVDILVNHLENKPPCLIQVKTRTGIDANQGWHMGIKHEEMHDDDMFYCFVALGDIHSDVYVIPAEAVANAVKESHATWLETPGVKGQQHNDTDMRRIRNKYGMGLKSAPDGWMDQYLENWAQLDQ
jgi:hypothetical protein